MMFAAAASAGAIAAVYAKAPTEFAASNTYLYARQIVAQIFNVYALRMAAVFLISQATLWMRTGVMPRWLALPDLRRGAVPAVHRLAVDMGRADLPRLGVGRERVHPRRAPEDKREA